ncbi:MAG: hypothetical protein QJR07_17660 [Acetobacteraceae bacterium]|nr:hypothetical protein [Acetobacteraceae bacterium]
MENLTMPNDTTTQAQRAERARWATIMRAPSAKGRSDLALMLAQTDMPAAQAVSVLNAANGQSRFAHLAGMDRSTWAAVQDVCARHLAEADRAEAQEMVATARRVAPNLFLHS